MKIALIGFGNVGQGFISILQEKMAELRLYDQFAPVIVAVATRSKGTLYHPDGLALDALMQAIAAGHLDHYPDVPGLARDWSPERIAHESAAQVIIEISPTNLETGQPALDVCLTALAAGKDVVLANKGPVAVALRRLQDEAKLHRRQFRFEGTVMAGTPSLRLGLSALAGCSISEVRGIINGTTNYILTQMEQEMSFEDALHQAQALGYAEADPSGDVDGWDAAGKLIILAGAIFGLELTLKQIDVTGIRHLTQADIAAARAEGQRWKLIAAATPQGAVVRPVRLPMADPLAGVAGAMNAITYQTDLLGDVTLIGPGAGRRETGFALLSDLLDIHRHYHLA